MTIIFNIIRHSITNIFIIAPIAFFVILNLQHPKITPLFFIQWASVLIILFVLITLFGWEKLTPLFQLVQFLGKKGVSIDYDTTVPPAPPRPQIVQRRYEPELAERLKNGEEVSRKVEEFYKSLSWREKRQMKRISKILFRRLRGGEKISIKEISFRILLVTVVIIIVIAGVIAQGYFLDVITL